MQLDWLEKPYFILDLYFYTCRFILLWRKRPLVPYTLAILF
ncbi:hypothetical protein [Pontibacter flavimaris]|nr:hypothetical protein [Pontibacter flavimaris]